ncbi:glyoxylate/hydroxypyruvate reductase HPR3-like isoform X2 [Phragmites australis]|uniref:glyoxylate/hydroxypyruvate reductase HPR3-like isoform X2 n=1 Tax=Phragmites australis TaxID=29695 RepID=UPI002D79FAE6|nr:glyoxylate/hydroxypyruvate reductase HPR3-like isoform X2 [Phragmites australis]
MESAAAASGERPILPALLLIRRLDETFAAELRQRFRVLDFYASGEALPAFLAAAATVPDPPRAAVVMGGGAARVDASFLDAVPSLRFVFSTGAGVDHIDLDECARRGVAVANSGRVYSADVADHAVGMLIDVLRRVSAAERFVRRGLWPVRGDYPLGSKDLASESDVLVVACALNKETMHIVNKDVLEALGKDGVIINIGRGRNIDEVELVRALLDGTIAGAGLDVFENEPKVPAELLSMDNVVLTHHVAVFTSESRSDLRNITIGNLEAFFSGKPLLTPVLP